MLAFRFNKTNFMILHSCVEMKTKMMYYCGNNVVQAKDNSTNGIDETTCMLWDIIASCEGKHI
jgi:hypothetical protein